MGRARHDGKCFFPPQGTLRNAEAGRLRCQIAAGLPAVTLERVSGYQGIRKLRGGRNGRGLIPPARRVRLSSVIPC